MLTNLDRYFFTQFLEPGENIDFVVHHHWWAMMKPMATAVLFGISMPLLMMWVFQGRFVIPLGILWLLIGLSYVTFYFVDWYYDAVVLTNSNVLDIEWRGVFHKSANRISYEHVDSVSYTVKGVFATLFHFGDLVISTTGQGEKGLKMTRDVREIQKIILAACDQVKADKGHAETEVLKKAIKALLTNHGTTEDAAETLPPLDAVVVEEVVEEDMSPTHSVMILETKSIDESVASIKKGTPKKRRKKAR